jgi:predicted murein hydrolase (TIGR00659 family)
MSGANIFALWVYLSKTPLLWLTVTLGVYAVTDALSRASGRNPLANPVLHAVWVIGLLLALTGTDYKSYFEGAQFVHFLLGPATVALAAPLYEHRRAVARALLPMAAALVCGAVVAMVSAVLTARLLGVPRDVLIALAPKSVTAGVAMGITQSMGGDPALTAVLVILTGIIGAIVVTPLMNALGITDWRARGFAAGIAAHGIGTARAFQVHPIAGTFAGIAMGLNALLTALLVPAFIGWLLP